MPLISRFIDAAMIAIENWDEKQALRGRERYVHKGETYGQYWWRMQNFAINNPNIMNSPDARDHYRPLEESQWQNAINRTLSIKHALRLIK